MKEKMIKTPVDPRCKDINSIVNPIYISSEQWKQMRYIPDDYRSRLVIVYFVKEEQAD